MNEPFAISPAPRLYVAVQDGCPACESMRPVMSKLRMEHPLEILVIELHLNRHEWSILGWQPTATPGFALVSPAGELVRKKTGAMNYRELLAWLAGRTRRRPTRSARGAEAVEDEPAEEPKEPEES